MATVTFQTQMLEDAHIQAVSDFLGKYGQTVDSLGENSLFRFLVASNAPLAHVGDCKCAGCHIIRGIESPLLALPLADLENKGILPMHDAAGKAMAEERDLYFTICMSCFYVGFPSGQQLRSNDYL